MSAYFIGMEVLTLLILCIASYTDYKYFKVYNWLTLPCIVFGVILTTMSSIQSLIAIVLWSILLIILVGSTRMMGFGDLKLILAILVLRGPALTIYTVLAASMLLLFYAYATCPDEAGIAFKNTLSTLFFQQPVKIFSRKKYPFAVFLSSGYVLVRVYQILAMIFT